MFIKDLSETIAFGKDFAKRLTPKSIILLQGPLGSGKTSIVQGIAEGLYIKENITSPTFALSQHYNSGILPLIHMDLYRLSDNISAKELLYEEEEELEQNKGVLIIEWPELIMPIISFHWLIKLNYGEKSGRYIEIHEPKLDRKS